MDTELGWKVREIKAVTGLSVMLDNGVSFISDCFSGAEKGDIWAVKHELGRACFGQVKQAVLLQPAGRK